MATSDPRPKSLLLLDTPSLYFRAFYGVPDSVRSPTGQPVNAVRGLVEFMAVLIERFAPARLVACMDADWRPAFRVALLPGYKAHRVAPDGGELVPAELVPQVAVIEEVLDAIGLARLGIEGFEADDVIATLAGRADGPVDIVTGDRDLFQLVDDARRVRIVYVARGVGRAELVDEQAVANRYGIPGRAYADFALLRGDPSDGLPGVAGIGEKSAAALLTRFGSLDALLAALATASDAGFPAGTRAKLRAAAGYVDAARAVVATRADAPLPSGFTDALPGAVRDPEQLVRLVEMHGIRSPIGRLLGTLGLAAGGPLVVPAPGVAAQPTVE